MRTRLAALLALLLLATLSGPAAGAASDRSLPSPALPDEPVLTARAHAEATLARTRSLFRERTPATARRRATAGDRDATLALLELRRVRADLSPADRQRADALLTRPTGDPTFPTEVQYDPAADVQAHCELDLCVHYVTSTEDAPDLTDADTNGVPDWVELVSTTTESVHDDYVEAGYRLPDPDGALGGGADQLDVYVADLGALGLYGYCASDQPAKTDGSHNYWAYCAVDDDYDPAQFPAHTPLENLQVTLAHEYYHAVQFAYDADEDLWFLEASATWAEDEVYDAVDDNLQYLPDGQLGDPSLPLDRFANRFPSHYGNWIFLRFLTERYEAETGGMPTLMREVWEDLSGLPGEPNRYSTQAIQRALAARGTSFTRVFGEFAAANRRPGQAYAEGAAYPAAPPARTWRLPRRRSAGTGVWEARLLHQTSLTGRFRPAAGAAARGWRLRVRVDMPPARTAPVARVLVHLRNGAVQSRAIRLGGNTAGATVVPFSSRRVRYVELVLVNASRRTRGCGTDGRLPVFGCFGIPRDDGALTRFSATAFRR